MNPRRLQPGETGLAQTLDLIRRCFAEMDGRIDPPSSMHRLTMPDMERAALTGEIWCIGTPALACVTLTPQPDSLYIGKLAVDPGARRQGLAARLIDVAAQRAIALGLTRLRLQTRIELVENHATFARLGFVETGRTAHKGYDTPTSITMERPADPGAICGAKSL
ncbi:GNAT family N-acetyltransferase [Arenibacterium halophilum]|uniref:GNAT family N-acetyltransferase n=1 Tax=Arenibacterium halophilum TaxID=2583821 RepID=A0ABY2X9N0_9RHOB|nr:GNAT family N-acetyltransferase [Arenibacterium halophilum]TMV12730.1 GNAT family N-acetyltransferase [Arenibacterium halophilum]